MLIGHLLHRQGGSAAAWGNQEKEVTPWVAGSCYPIHVPWGPLGKGLLPLPAFAS